MMSLAISFKQDKLKSSVASMRQYFMFVTFCVVMLFCTKGMASPVKPYAEAGELRKNDKIFTPPHAWLKRHRLYFTVPGGWKAATLPLDDPNFPKNWWIKNWESEGIGWQLLQTNNVPKGRKFEYEFLIVKMTVGEDANRDLFLYANRLPLRMRGGIDGFSTRGVEDDPQYESVWFILRMPEDYNQNPVRDDGRLMFRKPKPVYILCEARYLRKLKKYVLPSIHKIVETCSLK